jgi:hypothetical protein
VSLLFLSGTGLIRFGVARLSSNVWQPYSALQTGSTLHGMGQLSQVQVQLLSSFLQPLFYGIYLVTLGFCLKALLRRLEPNNGSQSTLSSQWRKPSDMNKPMLIVAILMAIIATLDLVITFARGWRAFTAAGTITSAEEILATNTGWIDILGARSELFSRIYTKLKTS